MSVDFKVAGTRIDLDRPETYLNLHEGNARDFLAWLGAPGGRDLWGELPARTLAVFCRARLEPGNPDDGRPARERGRAITFGRPAGRLHEYARALLALCERAGDGTITWG